MDDKWLEWAKGLQAIAQNGLTFSADPFDIERYEAIRNIAFEMMAVCSHTAQEHSTPYSPTRWVMPRPNWTFVGQSSVTKPSC